jgi:uncharacterized phage protein gp47/JayE
MPLNTPDNVSEIENNIKTDVSREIPNSRPWLKNSWFSALIVGISYRLFDVYENIIQALAEAFFDTSTIEQLTRQASWFGITREGAKAGSGNIIVGGTPATNIPVSTQFVTSDDITIESTASVNVTSKNVNPVSINSVGTTATVIFSSPHELSQGIQILVSGANETEYNGTFDIIVVDDVTVTYEISNSTTSPATGTIDIDYNSALVPCDAIVFGDNTNLDAGTQVEIVVAILGIDSNSFVDVNGFSGGGDIESVEDFRSRFLFRVQNPVANFNDSAIESKVRQDVFGVTRLFIQNATPLTGQVTIYPLFDNRPVIIPTGADLIEVKDSVLEIKPANTQDADVIVSALTPVATAFTFTSITPDTTEMRTAIENNLKQFFSDSVSPETDITEGAYQTAIYNTVDTVTGNKIEEFVLAAPVGNISITTGEIGTLGVVSF